MSRIAETGTTAPIIEKVTTSTPIEFRRHAAHQNSERRDLVTAVEVNDLTELDEQKLLLELKTIRSEKKGLIVVFPESNAAFVRLCEKYADLADLVNNILLCAAIPKYQKEYQFLFKQLRALPMTEKSDFDDLNSVRRLIITYVSQNIRLDENEYKTICQLIASPTDKQPRIAPAQPVVIYQALRNSAQESQEQRALV